ncbi:MAG: cation:proton antiporter [Chloroflexi bacterium]|nr:cation:proton antiporter [Chloroflexota bacterium]
MEETRPALDIAIILAAALAGGVVARRLGSPVILGYLIGGIAIGPYGLRAVQDVEMVEAMASVGVVLLMFALGLQFSLRELRQMGRVATLGGALQVGATAALGTGVGLLLGWEARESIFLGFIMAMSSTMVLLKTLMERGELDSPHGRVMLGLLIFQDLSVVPLMVFLPSLGQPGLGEAMAWASLKAVALLAGSLLLGARLVPWALGRVATLGSRELFLLSVVALSLGIAFGTGAAGLGMALGAFLAGLLVSESDFAYQALADVVPMRDVFAILFFVSIGMLVDPAFVWEHASTLTALGLAIVVGKFAICALVTRLFGYSFKTSLFVGAGMIQVGEFSLVLARVGLDRGAISQDLYSLTMASAIVTILLTPLALGSASWAYYRIVTWQPSLLARGADPAPREARLSQHTIICGYGRVGQLLAEVLERRGFPYLAIDLDPRSIAELRERKTPCIYGDASNLEVLAQAELGRARVLIIAFDDPIAAELTLRNARRLNPRLDVVARAHRDADVESIRRLGASEVVRPEFEASLEMLRHTLHRYGLTAQEVQYILSTLRQQ